MADSKQGQPTPASTPHPALMRLDCLVGTWRIQGRTPDAQEDNIRGRVTIEWLPGGYFLQQRGEIDFEGFRVHSLEIVSYDASAQVFPSYVFSNVEAVPMRYYWDVQGDVVTHWTDGSKYTGKLSKDGTVLAGGWRPDVGREGPDNVAYDATMIRVVK